MPVPRRDVPDPPDASRGLNGQSVDESLEPSGDMEGASEMNAKHTEFLAYDRIAELRREATADRRPVDDQAERAHWAARIGAFSVRTVGRIRLVLRHANANASA